MELQKGGGKLPFQDVLKRQSTNKLDKKNIKRDEKENKWQRKVQRKMAFPTLKIYVK